MAGTFVSPGVYVLERDFSDYAPALSTAIFGVVGGASWGPVNELTFISNENALINAFGAPLVDDTVTPNKSATPMITAGIHYLRNGSSLQVIRVSDGTDAAATVNLTDLGTPATYTSTPDLAAGTNMSVNRFVRLDVNNGGAVTIDLGAGAALISAVTRAEIITNLQAALNAADITVAPVTGGGGEELISLTTTAGGATAEIEFQEPPGNAATNATVDSLAETYHMQFLAAPQVQIDVDNSGAQDFTFTFTPDILTGTNSEPFNLSGGETLTIDVILPGQTVATETQTVTFVGGDFAVGGAATAEEVATAINKAVIGLSAADVAGDVVLTSDLAGTNAQISGVAGTSAATLGLAAAGPGGAGDAADATAVTAAEVAAVLTATITGATATAAAGVVTVTSTGAAGSASEVDVQTGGNVFTVAVTNGLDVAASLDVTLAVFGINVTSPNPSVAYNGTGPFDTIQVDAVNTGTLGNRLAVVVEDGAVSGTKTYLVTLDGFEVERFGNVLLAGVDALESEYVTFEDLGTSTEEPANGTYPLLSGLDGTASLAAGDYIGAKLPGNTTTGMQLLANAELTDVNIIAAPGVDDGTVIAAMDTLCQGRGDCMFLADPPSGLDVSGVIDWHNGVGYPHAAFNTSYGATYWSWVSWYDNYNQVSILEPPSGFLAAIMAFTDQNSEPWFAPAGLTRGRIPEALDVEWSPDQGERDLLYGNGNAVNPIVNSISFGVFVRGQRTLQRSPTALDRVNVRRLLLVLRKVVATSIARLEFEPNDPSTRDRFVKLVNPFLQSVVARRGIEDYSIIIDETTNPPLVVNRNELRGKILLKPVKVAEVIVVEFTLLPSGATFAESLT